jgi:hypothetical protein
MAVAYDINSGEKLMNANELINISFRKTNEIRKTINGKL